MTIKIRYKLKPKKEECCPKMVAGCQWGGIRGANLAFFCITYLVFLCCVFETPIKSNCGKNVTK